MAVISQFQADPEASSGTAISLHETSSRQVHFLFLSIRLLFNLHLKLTISSDTPPETSGPVTRLPVNPLVVSGLISPDLADILAIPAEDAAVVKK